MLYIMVSGTKGDDPREVAERKRPYYGSRVDKSPQKKQRLSSHIGSSSPRLPPEIIMQIISEIIDRRTLLRVCLVNQAFKGFLSIDSFRSAYTEEVRRGEYTSDNAIDTITKHMKEHREAALMIFEVTWKGMIHEGQLKGAVAFLNRLGYRLDEEDFDTVLLSLRTMYDTVVLGTSWDTWAAALTAADFLHEEYRNNDTSKMIRRIRHEAASRRREIVCQSMLQVQQDNAFCVLKGLRQYYDLELYREKRDSEKRTKINDALIEVVQAMLRLSIQEHQWAEACRQAYALLDLNGDVDSYLQTLKNICSQAISEDRWADAMEIMGSFKNYTDVAKESLDSLRSQWYAADGIRWTYGNAVF
ncbi:hypothetical protein VE01_09435 [Pseudogymnoascus verrucosus]|uniref:F-box domain-containing protein n=1 Tax=Pseudogymnoascus verrucosus TaxID=342668 RepID=A0A1B8G9I9_9PEZI|nr:uncharacterized protein VE01_09435 [Pseudogymnoascus verrucosus]OBT92503.2 hypothetical protein VE01_09435 [Pseudogymnoascus verrucosus]